MFSTSGRLPAVIQICLAGRAAKRNSQSSFAGASPDGPSNTVSHSRLSRLVLMVSVAGTPRPTSTASRAGTQPSVLRGWSEGGRFRNTTRSIRRSTGRSMRIHTGCASGRDWPRLSQQVWRLPSIRWIASTGR